MKNERGHLEIQSALMSGPEHFGEISEKPETFEKSRLLMKNERGDLEIQDTLVSEAVLLAFRGIFRNVTALTPEFPEFRGAPFPFSLKPVDFSIFSGFSWISPKCSGPDTRALLISGSPLSFFIKSH